MISFLRTWANQIIVALIIATIFEMILPNGNSKKYVKMVIGLYVLFTMIQPVVTKISGNNLEIVNFNYQKYFDESVLETSSQDFDDNNSKLIEQAYIDNIKNDIQIKIKEKGYEVISCNINILKDTNASNYGAIQSIQIKLKKIQEKNETNDSSIQIENVNVDINNNSSETNNTSNLSGKEKKELIEYLSNEYSIDIEKISIN